jgi:hypothetical protein
MRNKVLTVAMLGLLLAIGPAVWAHDHGGSFPTPSPTGPTATPTPFAYTDANVKGTYSTEFHGFLLIASTTPGNPPSLSPVAGFGNFTADGMGNITGGTDTFNAGGSVCTGTITGTYSVNADGTGSSTVTFTSTGPGTNCSALSGAKDADFEIGWMGRHLKFFTTDSDAVISGEASQPGGGFHGHPSTD